MKIKLSVVGCRLSAISYRKFLFAVGLFFLITANCSLLTVFAQDDNEKDAAPPPLKIVSKEEKRQLDAEIDVTKRTKLALALTEARLKAAENFNSREQYREMFDELGSFDALIDKTLEFLKRSDNGRGKVLNNFKRLDLSLRTYLPRIEVIRRDLPAQYEFYVRSLAKNVREARARAVEPFFGATVVDE